MAAAAAPTGKYSVFVTVKSAANLVAGDNAGKKNASSDPFVTVKIGDRSFNTKRIDKSLNPTWDETFEFYFQDVLPAAIEFHVWDWDRVGKNDSLGHVSVNLADVAHDGTLATLPTLQLIDVAHGTLTVSLSVHGPRARVAPTSQSLGMLLFTLDSAINVPDDVHVKLTFGDKLFESKVAKRGKTKTAELDTEARLWITQNSSTYRVQISVFDKDTFTPDDLIGIAYLDVAQFLDANPHTIEAPLLHLRITNDSQLASDVAGGDANGPRLAVNTRYLTKETILRQFWERLAQYFDGGNNGTLDKDEFHLMLSSIGAPLSPEEVDEIYTKMDVNRDGTIAFTELANFMVANPQGHFGMTRCPITGQDLSKLSDEAILCTVGLNLEKHSGGKADGMMKSFLFTDNYLTEKTVTHNAKTGEMYNIEVMERRSGQIVSEHIPAYIKSAIRALYRSRIGRGFGHSAKGKQMLIKMTRDAGVGKDKPSSKEEIPHFIQEHNINVAEIEHPVESYNTFNEFFYRKLKPGARTIDNAGDNKVAVSCGDSRLNAYETMTAATEIWIKGERFTLGNLFGPEEEANAHKFANGSLVICRLAPQDYHRVHVPVDGTFVRSRDITGTYYTVSPLAVRRNVDVYTENRRTLIEFETPGFGTVMCIMVGATMVGSIHLLLEPGKTYAKGDEMGYFAFGGSTVLMIFQAGKIQLDSDLLENSRKPIETLVKMGMRVGSA